METPIKSPEAGKSNEAFKVTGNWNDQSKKLKEKFSQLTDEDLKFEEGKEDELLGRVEQRLGKKREDVISILKAQQDKV